MFGTNSNIAYRKFTEINIVYAMATFLFSPFLAPYLSRQGFADWQITLMFVAFPLGAVIFGPLTGILADKYGRRRLIVSGLLASVVSVLIYLLYPTWYGVMLARFIDAAAPAFF